MQLSFKVTSIDDLRQVSFAAPALGTTTLFTLNHGNALYVSFSDPESSTVEVYIDTPFYVSQPHGDPLDLSKSDGELMAETEANCRQEPSFMAVERSRRSFGLGDARA